MGQPYLTRKFFDIAQDRLRDDILLVFAMRLMSLSRCAEHHRATRLPAYGAL
jgi:predicted N-acyltransferase